MKKQLNFILLAVMAVFSITFVSCGNDDDEPNSAFVGTWHTERVDGSLEPFTEGITYTQLRSDGTYVEVDVDEEDDNAYEVTNGTWSVSDNKLTATATTGIISGIPVTYEIKKVEGDKITLSFLGTAVYLVRVSDSVIEKYL